MKTKLNFVPFLAIIILLLWSFSASAGTKDPIGDNATTVVNNSVDGVKTVYNDLKSTAPEIKDALESAAKELKVGVNKVWDILVNQQRVWSIAYLVLTLSSLCSWFFFYKQNFRALKEGEYTIKTLKTVGKIKNTTFDPYYEGRQGYEHDNRGKRYVDDLSKVEEKTVVVPLIGYKMTWFKYIHLILCLGLSFFSYWHFSDMLTGFINPEYGAMKTILTFAESVR